MKRVRALTVIVTAMLALGGGVVGAAEDVVVRTSVNPQQAWVGQRVLLSVEVLGADGWAQITDVG